jgi:hypothetical protein
MRIWRKLVIHREKWRGIFDRPKPTAGCSANGRRRIYIYIFVWCGSLPVGQGLLIHEVF